MIEKQKKEVLALLDIWSTRHYEEAYILDNKEGNPSLNWDLLLDLIRIYSDYMSECYEADGDVYPYASFVHFLDKNAQKNLSNLQIDCILGSICGKEEALQALDGLEVRRLSFHLGEDPLNFRGLKKPSLPNEELEVIINVPLGVWGAAVIDNLNRSLEFFGSAEHITLMIWVSVETPIDIDLSKINLENIPRFDIWPRVPFEEQGNKNICAGRIYASEFTNVNELVIHKACLYNEDKEESYSKHVFQIDTTNVVTTDEIYY